MCAASPPYFLMQQRQAGTASALRMSAWEHVSMLHVSNMQWSGW